MAKEKKVNARETPKYSTSSDEDSSDDEVDYTSFFKGLDRAKVEKINELIDALNEKDRLLERQEDILYEEHDKFVSVQKSLALEIKRNELLSSELSICNESISSLKDCPVRHPTESKNCLPTMSPTAPSCLGAIKGTPRRIEESFKHSLIIPEHQDFILAHSIP
jgi:hypothetical protein